MSVENKIRVVGIGEAGIRMLASVHALNLPNVLTVAVDTNVDTVKNAQASKKLPLEINPNGDGTGGNTKLAKDAAMRYVQYLAKVARHTDVLVLLGGLGGGTASIIAPIISKLAQENTLIISLCAIPMQVEGESKRNLAKKSFEFLKGKSAIAAALDNDSLIGNSIAPIEEAFTNANNNVAQTVELIASGFAKNAFLKIDSAVLKSAFSGRQTYIGCATASIENVTRAFDEIKVSPMMVGMSKVQNMLVSIKCPKTSSMNEIKQILKLARENFEVKDKIFYSVCVDENTSDVKILAIASQSESDATVRQEPEKIEAQSNLEEPSAPIIANQKPAPSIDDDDELEQPTPVQEQPKQLLPANEPVQEQKPVEFKPEPKPADKKSGVKEQMSFEFDERGLFEHTPINERKGIDLDVPAFSRKRIKITLL